MTTDAYATMLQRALSNDFKVEGKGGTTYKDETEFHVVVSWL